MRSKMRWLKQRGWDPSCFMPQASPLFNLSFLFLKSLCLIFFVHEGLASSATSPSRKRLLVPIQRIGCKLWQCAADSLGQTSRRGPYRPVRPSCSYTSSHCQIWRGQACPQLFWESYQEFRSLLSGNPLNLASLNIVLDFKTELMFPEPSFSFLKIFNQDVATLFIAVSSIQSWFNKECFFKRFLECWLLGCTRLSTPWECIQELHREVAVTWAGLELRQVKSSQVMQCVSSYEGKIPSIALHMRSE